MDTPTTTLAQNATPGSSATGILDPAKPEHEKALRKLERDLIMWFTTTSTDGRPHAVPVWFFWHEGAVLVFSRAEAVKVKHVRRGSPVLVHLDAGKFGNDVVVLNGTAEVSRRPAAQWITEFRDAYASKYDEAIEEYGMSLDDITATFDTAIVFTPERVTAW
jgi:PPOX class probable F420-dependent enzyme